MHTTMEINVIVGSLFSNIFLFSLPRNIGGPLPVITKRQQGHLIFDALNTPQEERKFFPLPLAIFDVLVSTFGTLESLFKLFGNEKLTSKFGDAAELARIVHYYASEPMVATGPGEFVKMSIWLTLQILRNAKTTEDHTIYDDND